MRNTNGTDGMTAGAIAPSPRPRGRLRVVAAVAAVVLVAVMASTIFTLHAGTSAPMQSHYPQPPVELRMFTPVPDEQPCDTSSAGQGVNCPPQTSLCPRDAAWSPDDARVAVLSFCFGNMYDRRMDARVFVYDTQSGRRLLDLSVLYTLQHLPNMPVPGRTTTLCSLGIPESFPSIESHSLLWSHDGTRLEIPFYLTYKTGLTATNICYGWAGLLLVNPDGSSPQALYHAYGDGNTSPSAPANYDCSSVWDLTTGSLVPTPVDTSAAGQSFSCLSPALSYAWGAGGMLTPRTPLPAADTSATNVCPAPGDPNGDATVSIWQPGYIGRQTPSSPYQNTPAFYIWWTSSFAASSPDGRYVLYNLYLSGLFTPSGQALPTAAALTASGLGSPPVLPVPGQAIAQRLAALPAMNAAGQDVAFRPDGRVVATGGVDAAASSNSSAQRVSKPVVLYDCASGRKLASLTPITDAAYVDQTFPSTLLRWSPDGKYLLYADSTYGAGTIWGPAQLPQ